MELNAELNIRKFTFTHFFADDLGVFFSSSFIFRLCDHLPILFDTYTYMFPLIRKNVFGEKSQSLYSLTLRRLLIEITRWCCVLFLFLFILFSMSCYFIFIIFLSLFFFFFNSTLALAGSMFCFRQSKKKHLYM